MMIMLFPALIFMVFMGWCMYWVSNRKRPENARRTAPKKDNVTLMDVVFEETQQMING
jgi:hypothetical protein